MFSLFRSKLPVIAFVVTLPLYTIVLVRAIALKLQMDSSKVFRVTQLPDTLMQQLAYERIASEWEHYERQIWQTTTFSMTIVGSLVFVTYTQTDSCIARMAILVVATIVGSVFRMVLVKQRMFSITRSVALEKLEVHAHKSGTLPFIVQRVTSTDDPEIRNMYARYISPRNWTERQRALDWLDWTVRAFLGTMVVLAVLDFLALLHHHGYLDKWTWLTVFC